MDNNSRNCCEIEFIEFELNFTIERETISASCREKKRDYDKNEINS